MSTPSLNKLQVEDLQVEGAPGVRILKPVGPMTIANFFDFQDLSRRDTSRALIVDMAEVPYMDSAALGCILGIHVSCERSGRRYALVNVNDRLSKMFEVCSVHDVLVMYPTVADAQKAIA